METTVAQCLFITLVEIPYEEALIDSQGIPAPGSLQIRVRIKLRDSARLDDLHDLIFPIALSGFSGIERRELSFRIPSARPGAVRFCRLQVNFDAAFIQDLVRETVYTAKLNL